jgi:hypothetical protein
VVGSNQSVPDERQREYGTDGNNGTHGKEGQERFPSIPLFPFVPYSQKASTEISICGKKEFMFTTIRFKILFVVFALAVSALALADELPFSKERLNHWAYKPVQKPAVPVVKQRAWVKTPVDAFILQKLEANGLTPAAPADKVTLLRRATFDLTGLPPTPEEVTAFVNDRSPKAFARVVDRLLASPRYGEKWARHWLDLARYAETDGFNGDHTRPHIWRYRDYVIRAFNSDKPYDRFVKEQIAGDELWPDDPDALVATGFNRHFPDEWNARNLRQRRQEILNDITDTVGSALLGTTYACARCHDHKFDAVLQKDYYKLQSYFAAMRTKDDFVLASKKEQAEYAAKLAVWEEKTKSIRAQLAIVEAPAWKFFDEDALEKYPEEIDEVITMPPAKRSPLQWSFYHMARWQYQFAPGENGKNIEGQLKGEQKEKWQALRKQLATFDAIKPAPLPLGSGITDIGREAPAHHLLKGGTYDAYGAEVQPGVLSVIDPRPATITPCDKAETTGRRTALADWLTDPKNPLVARVMVNRLWQHHFGRGIVGTPNDFGMMREKESHRELLDWLAATFVEQGWSLKKMHRLMMLSNAYSQATTFNEASAQRDNENQSLWHFRRRRLTGEELRDAILQVSGTLNPQMYGPSVYPEIPAELSGWKRNQPEDQQNRRSIYVFVRRKLRFPLFQAFDMPDTHESCGRRNVTTTAPQALNLLNDPAMLRAAQAFAGRVAQQAGNDLDQQITLAYQLAYHRAPTAQQLQAAREFIRQQTALAREGQNAAALVDFCHALLNSNEFVYVN